MKKKMTPPDSLYARMSNHLRKLKDMFDLKSKKQKKTTLKKHPLKKGTKTKKKDRWMSFTTKSRVYSPRKDKLLSVTAHVKMIDRKITDKEAKEFYEAQDKKFDKWVKKQKK